MLKWLDIPPLWLAFFAALAWAQPRLYDGGLSLAGPITGLLSGLLLGGGVLLMLLAVTEMRRQRTTVLPHAEAERLVTSGIFKRSRNPIYAGDVLVLAGLVLRFDAVLALPLIPVFVWLLERRFIVPEEDRLRRKFRIEYAQYCRRVRRWA